MRRLAFALVALTAVAILGYYAVERDARAAGNNPDAISVDLDPANAPANTAVILGSLESCARIDENNVLDQDEDTTADTLDVDVTVTNIPSTDPMITFNYIVHYNETALTIQTANHNFLLFANGGSMFSAGDSAPDTNGDDAFQTTVIDSSDYNVIPPEFGSGVLSRYTISSDAGAAAGEYPVTLTEAVVIDTENHANPADVINNGSIAVDQTCPVTTTPTPTPAPTESPTPTPSPTPEPTASPTPPPHLQGDVDCSGAVLATDALKVLRHIAGLSVVQTEPCDNIGTGGPPLQGDVDCSTAVLATDALKILRHVAGLSVSQNEPPPCADIGT